MKKTAAMFLSFFLAVSVLVPFCAAAVRKGDVNGDGEINNKDVVKLFHYVSGNRAGCIEDACDYNGDGKINNKDVLSLFRYTSQNTGETQTSAEMTLGPNELPPVFY